MIKSNLKVCAIVMDSDPQQPTTFKSKKAVPEDIEVPSFEFENLLYDHYKRYPKTAAIIENPVYLNALMNPFKKFYIVPINSFILSFVN